MANAFTRLFTRDEEPSPQIDEALIVPARAADVRSVTSRDATSLSSVYRALSIISTSVRQLPLHAERDGVVLANQPSLIAKPNLQSTLAAFVEETTLSLAVSGNAYWLKDVDAAGRVTNLTVLNPAEVTETHTNWGRVTKWTFLGQDFTPDRIVHLKFMRVLDQVKGLGPIQADQAELRGALDTRDFAANWFPDSGTPAGGYLKSDQFLNDGDGEKARDTWKGAVEDRVGVPVLGNGFEFKSFHLSPKDALWIEAQQFDVTRVARMFGIPFGMLGAQTEGSSLTYTNVEQEWLAFTKFALSRYLGEIEDAFTELLPRGTRARFNLDAFLRADTTTRYAAHAVALEKGFMTVNEVRALENLPPLPEPAPAPAPSDDPASEEDTNV